MTKAQKAANGMARSAILAALFMLAIIHPAHAQISSGGGVVGFGAPNVPPAAFWVDFNKDAGSGTTAHSKRGDDCTLSTITWVEDPTSSGHYAIDIDDTADAITCGTSLDAYPSHATGFTVSVWVRLDTYGATTTPVFVSKSGGTTNQRSWVLRANDTTDNFQFILGESSGTQLFDVWGTAADSVDPYMGTSTWVNVVAVITGPCTGLACGNVVIYINGSAVTTTLTTDNTGTLRSDASDSVRVGSHGGVGNAIDGRIDEARVIPQALNATQVAALFAEGRP